MYVEIGSKEELIVELKKRLGTGVIIHYNCEECGDEQVTYAEEITDEMIDEFQSEDYIMVSYPCTSCGNVTLFLDWDMIQSIEEM